MCQQWVSLHLTKSNTPCPLPPLHRLMRENINRTSCANLKKQRHQTAALPLSIWCIDTGVPSLLPFSRLVHCILYHPAYYVPGTCLLPCVSAAGSTRRQRRHQPQIPCHQCHCTNAHCQSSCNQLQKYKNTCPVASTQLQLLATQLRT